MRERDRIGVPGVEHERARASHRGPQRGEPRPALREAARQPQRIDGAHVDDAGRAPERAGARGDARALDGVAEGAVAVERERHEHDREGGRGERVGPAEQDPDRRDREHRQRQRAHEPPRARRGRVRQQLAVEGHERARDAQRLLARADRQQVGAVAAHADHERAQPRRPGQPRGQRLEELPAAQPAQVERDAPAVDEAALGDQVAAVAAQHEPPRAKRAPGDGCERHEQQRGDDDQRSAQRLVEDRPAALLDLVDGQVVDDRLRHLAGDGRGRRERGHEAGARERREQVPARRHAHERRRLGGLLDARGRCGARRAAAPAAPRPRGGRRRPAASPRVPASPAAASTRTRTRPSSRCIAGTSRSTARMRSSGIARRLSVTMPRRT